VAIAGLNVPLSRQLEVKRQSLNPKEVILSALKERPSISVRDLAVQCEMSIHSVQHHINKLKDAGAIRHVGSTKAGQWEIINNHVLKGTKKVLFREENTIS